MQRALNSTLVAAALVFIFAQNVNAECWPNFVTLSDGRVIDTCNISQISPPQWGLGSRIFTKDNFMFELNKKDEAKVLRSIEDDSLFTR